MTVRDAIAESIWANVKAHDVAAWCVSLGLAPAADGEDPFRSKRTYVKSRLTGLDITQLVAVAQRLLEEWDDEALQTLVDGASGARSVDGAMRNLIFASTGPKPRIVLRDAIDNVVEIVENGQFCLYYDRALGDGGLRWADMVTWWADLLATDNLDVAAKSLWKRLNQSLDDGPERLLFRTYTGRYAAGSDVPALVPRSISTTIRTSGAEAAPGRCSVSGWTSCSCCPGVAASSSKSTGSITMPDRTGVPTRLPTQR
ncbi:hypothetical protein F9L07_03530 [Pimelobacter simplex]|uniref:Uncharacterized protein n=1 Tax=Nocardioides simplex TaxID=2045 RepID=A0A7J5DYL2_NOCSI|nr:hypothetical protein [Pimelobacter simplex]KAB2811017.1 hypothetical protein F9L07_03530 [Pimelobacter simplex]